jgi:hypothetical protein
MSTVVNAIIAAGDTVKLRALAAVQRDSTGSQPRTVGTEQRNDHAAVAEFETLIYELLDAHWDTSRLAEPLLDDSNWFAHLEYLRRLQRVARERLARAPR